MTQLSRERLEALANIESLECMALPASHAEAAEMARRLLAAEAQEPVAYMIGGHYLMHAQDPKVDNYASAVPLYAEPQPVAVPDVSDLEKVLRFIEGLPVPTDGAAKNGKRLYDFIVACRSAMLNAEPVSQPYTLPQWIPCSERMPKKSERVLIFIDFGSDAVPPSIHDAQFTGSTFRRGNATVNVYPLEDGFGVTHWMPLPTAPQEPTK